MDFFKHQDSNKTRSHMLLAGFVAAMLITAVAIHICAVLLAYPVSKNLDFSVVTKPGMAFIGLVWLICLSGAFFRFLDVRAGGPTLARRFGAVSIAGNINNRQEQQLHDIVSEIAIASRCGMPEIFILTRESRINAFVVGGFSDNEALVLSRGAVDNLDRDELKAIVAHEFGHIAQGDLALNMRLLIALGGLNAMDEVGRLLTFKHDGKLVAQPGAIVGFLIRAVGITSTSVGRLMRSAFSRRREYLADACAVQYTRNPEALASVLTLIRDQDDSSPISAVHAEEISHLCFQTDTIRNRFRRILATHPPIQKRIDAVDPHFAVKRRSKVRSAVPRSPRLYSVGQGASASPMSRDHNPEPAELSDQLSMALSDSSACLAALHALFVSDDIKKSPAYFEAVGFAYNKIFANQVQEFRDKFHMELKTEQLAVIEQATKILRDSIQLDNRQRLLKSLEKMLTVEGEFTLINYATLQLVRRKLDAEFPVLELKADATGNAAEMNKSKAFDSMGQEFALLLSLIIEVAGKDFDMYDDRFKTALSCYTKEHHPRRSADEPDIVPELEAAFQTLYVQPRPIREAFVQHCLEIAQSDGHIANDERAILDLFAASLKCDPLAA